MATTDGIAMGVAGKSHHSDIIQLVQEFKGLHEQQQVSLRKAPQLLPEGLKGAVRTWASSVHISGVIQFDFVGRDNST